jgi:hypothetical protein
MRSSRILERHFLLQYLDAVLTHLLLWFDAGGTSILNPQLFSISYVAIHSHRTSPWNAQVKDRLEGQLHELVCSGQLDLKTAQQAIASNWIEAYKLYVSPNPPISRTASPGASESPLNSGQVWVNTKSGKYWKPGSRYFGKTKQGEYMSEEEAVQKGYRPANGTGE